MSASLYSAIADGYDASYLTPSHRKIYDSLAWDHVLSLPIPHRARIVDVGCGSGRWARRWCALGHHVTGIEQAPGMIASLRADWPQGDFALIQGDMDAVDLTEASADLVLAMGSLQYARDPAALLRRFARWLRPGGHVCVYVDSLVSLVLELIRNRRDEEALEAATTRSGRFRHEEHAASVLLYDQQSLRRDFEQAGLADIRCHGLGVRAGIVGRAAATADMQVNEAATMQIERRLTAIQTLADTGLHILAVGSKTAAQH